MIEKLRGDGVGTHNKVGFRRGRVDIDMFAEMFRQEYGDRKEITRDEVSYFASFAR